MSWKGECKKCGMCCTYDIKWIPFHTEIQKEEAIEWATARGFDIKQTGIGVIQANYEKKCSQLEKGLCKMYDNKPRWCSYWPDKTAGGGMVSDFVKKLGLDLKFILFEGCGYEWIEDSIPCPVCGNKKIKQDKDGYSCDICERYFTNRVIEYGIFETEEYGDESSQEKC